MEIRETDDGWDLMACGLTYPVLFATREEAEAVGMAAEEAESKRLERVAAKNKRELKKAGMA